MRLPASWLVERSLRANLARTLPFTAARCGASEVVLVDGVLVGVVVGVGGAAGYGVGLVEAAGVGVVEADSHQCDAGEGVVGALFGAEPAVAGVGGGLEVGDAEFAGLGVAGDGGGGGRIVDGGDGVAVEVGELEGDGARIGLDGGEVAVDAGDVTGPAGGAGGDPGGAVAGGGRVVVGRRRAAGVGPGAEPSCRVQRVGPGG